MDCDQKHIWAIRIGPGSTLIPIADEETAVVLRDRGWQVTELPLATLDELGLRCLGIELEDHSGDED